ncbi:metal-sensitive transcriptional regulator [Corynebacterium xerosis]|uniref:Metal-sensitive transcriptional regulator n=1 Tax=Corynebacterium xerosis TaxID=1725 RepID=A0A7X9SVN8_9CORY|nr:metal-sensitive transcriptional regulator [Corynebacterium xerosis]SQB95424.1 copper-sensing transcriptional repressor CsoR [Clostridium paraputrificum]
MRNDLQDLDGGDVRHELPLTEVGISPAEEAVSCCGGGHASTAAGESPAEAAILAGAGDAGGCADGSCGCSHHGYISDKKRYLARLKRIEGQVRGVQRMIDDEKYCIDILTQISALNSALKSVSLALLDDHLRHCVVSAAQDGGDELDVKLEEASDAIRRLAK